MEEKNNKYYVYMHINKIDGKIYIGITGKKHPSYRWGKNGSGYKYHNKHFWNAIQKYGWNNFEHIVLFDNLIQAQACQIEKDYIKYYNTNNYDFGYNQSTGGELSSVGHIVTEETKQKISKTRTGKYAGKNSSNYGLVRSEETKEKIKQSRIGSHHTKETLLKMSKTRIGKKQTNETIQKRIKSKSIPVYCITTNEIFISATEAAVTYDLEKSHICRCCKGTRKTTGKLLNGNRMHWQYLDEYMQQNGYTDISQILNVIIHNENN